MIKVFYKFSSPRMAVNKDTYTIGISLLSEQTYKNEYGQDEKSYKSMVGCYVEIMPDVFEAKDGAKKVEKMLAKAAEDLKKAACDAIMASEPFPKS